MDSRFNVTIRKYFLTAFILVLSCTFAPNFLSAQSQNNGSNTSSNQIPAPASSFFDFASGLKLGKLISPITNSFNFVVDKTANFIQPIFMFSSQSVDNSGNLNGSNSGLSSDLNSNKNKSAKKNLLNSTSSSLTVTKNYLLKIGTGLGQSTGTDSVGELDPTKNSSNTSQSTSKSYFGTLQKSTADMAVTIASQNNADANTLAIIKNLQSRVLNLESIPRVIQQITNLTSVPQNNSVSNGGGISVEAFNALANSVSRALDSFNRNTVVPSIANAVNNFNTNITGDVFSTSTTRAVLSAGDNLSYDSANGVFSLATSTVQAMVSGGDTFSTSTTRGVFSNTATGLSYDNSTGITSLTSGYNIPTTASTTEWANSVASVTSLNSTTSGLTTSVNTLNASTTNLSTFYQTPSTRITAGTGLSWSGNTLNSTAVGSQWTTSGSNIGYTTGNVGIGTASPSGKLDVRGDQYWGTTQKFWLLPDWAGYGELGSGTLMGSYGTGSGSFSFFPSINGGDSNAKVTMGYSSNSGVNVYSAVEISNVTSGYGKLLLMKSGGNVGIGTTTPGTALSVAGAGSFTGNITSNGNVTASAFYGDGSNLTGITSFSTSTTRNVFSNAVTGLSYDNSTGITSLTSGYNIPLTASTTEWASKVGSQWNTSGANISYPTGNVGIGTSTPANALTVVGNGHFTTGLSVGGTVATTTGTRVFMTPGVLTQYSGSEANPRVNLGISAISNGVPGLVINSATSVSASQTGAAIGQGSQNTLSFYVSNGSSLTERARFDTTGFFGIGTTSPLAVLSVQGSTTAPTSALFTVASSSGSRLFTIAANGNVGVGTSSPSSLFTVAGDINFTGALRASGDSGTTGMVLLSNGSSAPTWVATSSLGISGGGSGTINSGLAGQFAVYNAAGTTLSGTSTLYISNGNIGVGTTTPGSKLTVAGTIVANNLTVNGLPIASPAASTIAIGTSAGDGGTTNTESAFIGYGSGVGGTGLTNSNFMGTYAGGASSNLTQSNFFGYKAGWAASGASYSNFLGYTAGFGSSGGVYSNFLGFEAGRTATNAAYSNFLGYDAGYGATNAAYSNFFGYNAGSGAANARNSIFIGPYAGYNDTVNNANSSTSIAIGRYAGTGGFSNSIAIGHGVTNSAALQTNVGNVLYLTGIYNSDTPSASPMSGGALGIGTSTPGYPLTVAGDINFTGALRANGDAGTTGMVLLSNGSSAPTWVATSTLGISGGGASLTGTTGQFAFFSGTDTAVGTSTLFLSNGNIGIGTTTPASALSVVGAGNFTSDLTTRGVLNILGTGTSTVNSDILLSGDIIPSADNTYRLGTPSRMWRDVYIGPGSLYINGQKVLQTDNSNNVTVTADSNQNLVFKSAGTGDLELNPSGTGQILLKGNLRLSAGKTITTSDASPIALTNGADLGFLRIAGNTITPTNLNGGITIAATGTGGVYFTQGNVGIATTSPSFPLTVAGDINFTGALRANGSSGTTGMVLLSNGSSAPTWVATSTLGISGGGASLTGTTGQLAYFDGTNSVAGTSTIFISTAGNVGIGTSSPWSKFSVNTSGSSMTVGNDSSNYLAMSYNNAGTGVATSYLNTGGSGDRSGTITISTNVALTAGSISSLIDGNIGAQNNYWLNQTVAGNSVQFYFNGLYKVIDEVKYYQLSTATQGVWQWQVSNDGSNWTNIGNTFTLGGATTQTITELSSNTTGYRYYRMYGQSGSTNSGPWIYEMEFKIGNQTPGYSAQQTYASGAAGGAIALQPIGGSVGIGTLSPLGTLDVSGNLAIGSYAGNYFAPTNGLIVSGNVGIGTTTPSSALSVAGDINFTGALRANGSSGTTGMVLLSNGSSAPTWVATSTLGISGGGSSQWTTSGSDIYYTTGKVSIGTSTQTTAALTLAGSLSVSSSTNGSVIIGAVNGNSRGSLSLDIQSQHVAADKVASGIESVAVGLNNLTSGQYGVTMGRYNSVTGTYGTALGTDNSAWQYSASIGNQNTVSSQSAVAVGRLNNVSAEAGAAYGMQNSVSGAGYNLAMGYGNTVTAGSATAIGNSITNTIATTVMIGPNDASKITIASTGLGLGTTSPSAKLDIYGIAGSSDIFAISSSTNARLFTVGANGYVGLGTRSPSAKLDIYQGNITFSDGAYDATISGGTLTSGTALTAGDLTIKAGSSIAGAAMKGGDLILSGGDGYSGNAEQAGNVKIYAGGNTYNGAIDNYIGFYAGAAERMRILSSGNIGIGTTTSGSKLSVAGDINFTGALRANGSSGTTGMVLLSNGTSAPTWVATSSLGISGGGGSLSGGTNGYLARWTSASTLSSGLLMDDGTYTGINATSSSYTFNVQGSSGVNPFNVASSTGTSLFSINNAGNVGVGLTPGSTYKLEVAGIASTTQLYLPNTTSSTVGGIYFGGTRFIHNKGAVGTTFLGASAGNISNNAVGATGVGANALAALTSGDYNSAFGYGALALVQGGTANIAVGANALGAVVSGTYNTAIGYSALVNTTGSTNIAIGKFAGRFISSGSNNIVIGNDISAPVATGSNQLNIGNLIFGTGLTGTDSTIAGNIGIGSTTPYAKLTVAGEAYADLFTAGSTTATSTFAGGLNVGGGALTYDWASGLTNISNASLGATAFETDAGIITWIDMPVTSNAAQGTIESYSANIGGTSLFTVYSESSGSGGIQNGRIGVGTTTPNARFQVTGASGSSDNLFVISTSTNAQLLTFTSAGRLGIGTTTPGYALTVAGTSSVQMLNFNTNRTGLSSGIIMTLDDVSLLKTSTSSAAGTMYLGYGAGPTPLTSAVSGFNTGIGYQSMAASGISFVNNTALGYQSMYSVAGSNNTAIGYMAFSSTTSTFSSLNTAVGSLALGAKFTTSAAQNTALGYSAGGSLTSGNQNVFLGESAGTNMTRGSLNIMIGSGAYAASTTGSNQLNIGSLIYGTGLDGFNGTLSTGKIGIGSTTPYAKLTVIGETYSDLFTAGSTTATSTFAGGLNVGNGALTYDWASGLTNISNASLGAMTFESDSGMISWVDMPVTSASASGTVQSYSAQLDGNPALTVYGLSNGAGDVNTIRLGVGTTTPTQAFSVVGTINATNLLGGSTNLTVDANGNIIRDPSDENLKENIITLENSLAKIEKLRGVRYEWKDKDRFGSSTEIGVIAQEVEQVVPEVVSSGGLYKSVNIKNLVALLIEGVKELKTQVDSMLGWFGSSGDRFNVKGMVCVDDVCVSKDQFKQMLINSGSVMVIPQGLITPPEPTVNPTPSVPPTPTEDLVPTGSETSGDSGEGSNIESTPPSTPPVDPAPIPEPTPEPAPAPDPTPTSDAPAQ